MKVVLNLVERTLQGRDVELFEESLHTLVQVSQFRFDAQQTLFQRLETPTSVSVHGAERESYLIEHEQRWDLLKHDQSFVFRDLPLNIGQLAIDVVESRLTLFPRVKNVLPIDGVPNHLLVQLIRTLLEIRMLFGIASARVTVELLVQPIQLTVSFVHLFILFHLLVQLTSVFVDVRG